jgi:hypothetical protein
VIRILLALAVSVAVGPLVEAQGGGTCCGRGMAGVAGAPLESFEGRIVKVRLAPGEGMPAILVHVGNEDREVLLGPLRFLMARNFNPRVGDEVAGKAYKVSRGWVAALVTLKRTGQTVRLREENGLPVWRGGRW